MFSTSSSVSSADTFSYLEKAYVSVTFDGAVTQRYKRELGAKEKIPPKPKKAIKLFGRGKRGKPFLENGFPLNSLIQFILFNHSHRVVRIYYEVFGYADGVVYQLVYLCCGKIELTHAVDGVIGLHAV